MPDQFNPSGRTTGEDDRGSDARAPRRHGGSDPAGRNPAFAGSHGEGFAAGLEFEDDGDDFAAPGLALGFGAMDAGPSFAPRGEGVTGDFTGDFTSDHDGWSPGADAMDQLAAPRRRGPQGCQSADGRLRDEVICRLLQDRLLDASRITVEVEDGVITLMGAVRRPSDLTLAVLLTREAAPGAEIRIQLTLRAEPVVRGG